MIKLLQQFSMGEEDLFDPLSIRADDGLGDLVKDPLTQEHMANLAEKGWSAIEDGSAEEETKSQRAARIIARKNFGAIIDKSTTTFLDEALKQDMFPENVRRRVLIPPTTYTRKCIQWMVKSMTMNSSASAVKCIRPAFESQLFDACAFQKAVAFRSLFLQNEWLTVRHRRANAFFCLGETTAPGRIRIFLTSSSQPLRDTVHMA